MSKIKIWLFIFAFVFLVLHGKNSVIIEAGTLKNKESAELTPIANIEAIVTSGPAVVEESQEISTQSTTITTQSSEVKKILKRVQSTLERAEPWLEEIEKEAKRLEQTAQRFGEGIIKSFTGIVGKLIGPDGRIPSTTSFFTRIFGTRTNNQNNKDAGSKFCADATTQQAASSDSPIGVSPIDEIKTHTVDVSMTPKTVQEVDVKKVTTNEETLGTTTVSTTSHIMKDWDDADAILNEI